MAPRGSHGDRYAARSVAPSVQLALQEVDLALPTFKKLTKTRLLAHTRALDSFALAGSQQPDEEKDEEWPSLERGSKTIPSAKQLKFWIAWMLISVDGRVGPDVLDNDGFPRPPYIRRTSACNYLFTLYAAAIRNGIHIPSEAKTDALNFLYSEEAERFGKFNTAMKPKPVASNADVKVIIQEMWTSPHFRTSRMRMQLVLGTNIIAISSQRPGGVWESGNHRGSNEAFQYGDFTPWVFPNPDDPSLPGIPVCVVAVRFLKGMRHNKSANTEFILYAEPDEDRLQCSLHILLALGLEDGAFKNANTIEEALDVSDCPLGAKRLYWKDEWLNTPVMRAEELDGSTGAWTISRTRAMTDALALQLTKKCCLSAGMEEPATMYAMRRGAANLFGENLSPDQRTLLMGHNIESKMFQSSYQTRLSTVDVQALHAARDTGQEMPLLFAKVAGMNTITDPSLPTSLTPVQIVNIGNDEHIVEAQVAIDAAKAEVAALKLQANDFPTEAVSAQIAAAYRSLARSRCVHASLWSSLVKSTLAGARKEAYKIAAATGKPIGPDPRAVPFTAQTSVAKIGKARPLDDVTNRMKERASGDDHDVGEPDLDAVRKSFNPLQYYLDVAASVGDSSGKQLIASVQALIAMPMCFSTVYYPDESPTADNCCPAETCGRELGSLKHEAGAHIHACLQEQYAEDLAAELDDAYEPSFCPFTRVCGYAETGHSDPYATRAEFVTHVATHILGKDMCSWPDTLVPGKTTCGLNFTWSHMTDSDRVLHVAADHGFNLNVKPTVKFCFLCHMTVTDLTGHRQDWIDHLRGHFDETFKPFARRADTDVMHGGLPPMAAVDAKHNAILPGAFDYSARPRLDGREFRHLLVHPWFCPVCLFDEGDEGACSYEKRLHQYPTSSSIRKHLDTEHFHDLQPEDRLPCPVPSCGRAEYSPAELFDHLVLYHALPVCGAVNGTLRRLKTMASPDRYQGHDHDDEDARSIILARPLVPVPASAPPSTSTGETMPVEQDASAGPTPSPITHKRKRAAAERVASGIPVVKRRKGDDTGPPRVQCVSCKSKQIPYTEVPAHRLHFGFCARWKIMESGVPVAQLPILDFFQVATHFPELLPADPTEGRVFTEAAIEKMIVWLKHKDNKPESKPKKTIRPGAVRKPLKPEAIAKRNIQHYYADTHGDGDIDGWWSFQFTRAAAKLMIVELERLQTQTGPSSSTSSSSTSS